MVEVFREVRRVLRRDGTCWLNIGSSYAGAGPSGASYQSETTKRRAEGNGTDGTFRISKSLADRGLTYAEKKPVAPPGFKQKDLVPIPWLLGMALQQNGWYLRADIIWSKPNPMPESVTDRPTKSHEYLFLLTRSARYFYDADAIREPHSPDGRSVTTRTVSDGSHANYQEFGHEEERERWPNGGRNARSVWEIATQPYAEAHFATFPEELPRRCIAAGTSERGCCPECGAPWERKTATDRVPRKSGGPSPAKSSQQTGGQGGAFVENLQAITRTIGWRPACNCDGEAMMGSDRAVARPVPCVVLDPFMGSGTVALVARKLGRRSIGIELNPDYAQLAAQRLQQLSLLA